MTRNTYSPHTWTTGEVITREKMNKIEDGIAAIDTEIAAARGEGGSGSGSLGQRIDDIVIVSNTEPTSEDNEIWINTSTSGLNTPIEIPTQEEFENLENMIAPTEASSMASAAHANGSYFIYNGTLYEAIADIAAGGTITPNTNCKAVTVGGEVSDLKSAIVFLDKGESSINIADYDSVNCTFSATNTALRSGLNYISNQIPAESFGAVSFTADAERVGVIIILKSAIPSDISTGADLSGYLATGETGRHLVNAGETISIILPDDAKYLFISRVSQGIETLPADVTVFTKTAVEINLIKDDVQNVCEELAPTYNSTTGSYQMGDAVNHSGGLYVAKESASGEWDGTKWLSVSATEIARYSLWAVEPSIDVYDVINASTAKWYASGKYRGTITRINGAKRLCIKAGAVDCLYSLLKSGIVKSGETPDYADGFSGAVRITAGTEAIVNVPDDARYLYMISKNSSGNSMLPDMVLAYGVKPEQALSGLNVSVIGDSISAFTVMIPSGNLAYYTRSNAGVRVPTEMWWYHFSEITGGKLLINDAWSGSPVTDVRASTHTAMADVSRCQNLHSWEFGTSEDYDLVVTSENIGTLRQSPFRTYARAFAVGDYLKKVTPDIILIAGGGNDYNRDAAIGTWDGHTTLDTTNIHTFREAYANMINRMHEVYPNALVVCLKPWYWRQPVTAKKQAIINNGKTYKDYWDAICQIADLMSCPVIDGITIGFNPWNYYPTFCEDNADMPVHPNAMGQKIMGETVAEAMKRVCVGYVDWMKARS